MQASSSTLDDYPEYLTPNAVASYGALTRAPFEEWWPRVKAAFPNVPENVARYWLHEHWGVSPFAHLKSAQYRFELCEWIAEQLWTLRSSWCNFDPNNAECLENGRKLVQTATSLAYQYPTAVYMLQNGDFPTPIIILDNRDGHHSAPIVTDPLKSLPKAYVLIEGHTRFNIALHLQKTMRLKPKVSVWMMMRV